MNQLDCETTAKSRAILIDYGKEMQLPAASTNVSSIPQRQKLSPLNRKPDLKKVDSNKELPCAILFDYGEEMNIHDGTRVRDLIEVMGPGTRVLQMEGSKERFIRDPDYVLQRGCVYRTYIQQEERMLWLSAQVPIHSTIREVRATKKVRSTQKIAQKRNACSMVYGKAQAVRGIGMKG